MTALLTPFQKTYIGEAVARMTAPGATVTIEHAGRTLEYLIEWLEAKSDEDEFGAWPEVATEAPDAKPIAPAKFREGRAGDILDWRGLPVVTIGVLHLKTTEARDLMTRILAALNVAD